MPERCVLDLIVDGPNHLEAQVRPREACDRYMRIDHPELTHDVLLHVGGGRGGQCQYRWTAKSLGNTAEREIIGTEVVPPLTDAVRLIDDEEADRPRQQMLEERAILEAFRREVQHLAFALGNLPVRLARLRRRKVRVHCDRADALRRELIMLVFHERDEGTHHYREAGELDGG